MGSTGKTTSRYTREPDILTATPEPMAEEAEAATASETAERSLDELKALPYHYFRDLEAGGWEYEGDGKHAIQYMKDHTNSDVLLDEIASSFANRDAFNSWAVGNFMDGQQYRGFSKMSSRDQAMTRIYDKIIDKSELSKGIISSRLATTELLGLPKTYNKATIENRLKDLMSTGVTITSKGNMSSGLGRHGLTIGSSYTRKPIEYKFHFPAGSKGAGMWIGDKRANPGWEAKQREFMINRDTNYKVGGYKYDEKRKVYVVDMYYTGRNEHDYT